VERAEDEVAGLGGCRRDAHRFEVAHFADQQMSGLRRRRRAARAELSVE